LPEVNQGHFLADYPFCDMSGLSNEIASCNGGHLSDETARTAR
jgi:hypothetical protein